MTRRIRFALMAALLVLAGYVLGYGRAWRSGVSSGMALGRVLGAIGVILTHPAETSDLLERVTA